MYATTAIAKGRSMYTVDLKAPPFFNMPEKSYVIKAKGRHPRTPKGDNRKIIDIVKGITKFLSLLTFNRIEMVSRSGMFDV